MERTKTRPKRCCLGGHQSKTNTHNNNLYGFDCGSTIDQEGMGMVCNCGLFICYQCLRKIELMVINNQVMLDLCPNIWGSDVHCPARSTKEYTDLPRLFFEKRPK
mmetsp:Transcript_13931/g.29238  ORF Transcript_13931/g.29238 Transcript_13931/m.29238 type:complete len:105 (+) Transcript_13931:544-858(+)